MSTHDRPPMKRLRLHLTLDAHDHADLAVRLDRVVYAITLAAATARGTNLEVNEPSYHFDVVQCSDHTEESWIQAEHEWRERHSPTGRGAT